jgi:hypothetical protein
MGLADFISERFRAKVDLRVTAANGLAACAPQRGRMPLVVGSDREGIRAGLSTAGAEDPSAARVAWIGNTRELERFRISEALAEEALAAGLEIEGEAQDLQLDGEGNILS